MTRVAVFIDYRNTYMGARRAFGLDGVDFVRGQVHPLRLGIAVTQLGRVVDAHRELKVVHVFRGEPSSLHSPKGLAACQRQVRFWKTQNCVSPVTRPLKYYPIEEDSRGQVIKSRPQEKGIDVLIALAMVIGAHNDEFDVAVPMSADTDLVPAVERSGCGAGSECRQTSRGRRVGWFSESITSFTTPPECLVSLAP